MKQRINVSVDGELLKEIDMLADKLGQSRSAFMCMASATYIQQYTTMRDLPTLIKLVSQREDINQES